MKRMLAVLSIVLLSTMLILGCDGGDEVSDTSGNVTFSPENAVVLSGVAAADKPLQGFVQAINTRGETTDEVQASEDGRFSVDIANHGPFLLRMIDPEQGLELYSFTTSEGHVNLTPLTNLAMYIAAGGDMALKDLFHEWDGNQLSPEEVQTAAATVSANLAPLLNKQDLDHRTYDFFHTDFQPDDAGMGAVLSTVRIHIETADTLNGSIRILDASGRQLVPFDAATPVTPSPAPSATDQ